MQGGEHNHKMRNERKEVKGERDITKNMQNKKKISLTFIRGTSTQIINTELNETLSPKQLLR